MKTSEKIKKGIECCQTMVRCSMCTYNDIGCNAVECQKELLGDSLVLINQLESREKKLKSKIAKLEQRLAQAERERDAAIHDLWGDCCYCAHNSLTDPRCIERCKRCKHAPDAEDRDELGVDRWEWRGVCPENSSDEEHQQA